jgi:hypothetical protein
MQLSASGIFGRPDFPPASAAWLCESPHFMGWRPAALPAGIHEALISIKLILMTDPNALCLACTNVWLFL